MTARRGDLAVPNPELTEKCADPRCTHTEGVHLVCGCQGTRNGQVCGCPSFALPAPICPHCATEFNATWKHAMHMRFRTPSCLQAERERAAAAAVKQRTREYRAKRTAAI